MPQLFEFLLPNVDFRIGDVRTTRAVPDRGEMFSLDRIEFILDGRCWTLRKAVLLDGAYVPYDVFAEAFVAGATNGKPDFKPVALLQVAAEGFDRPLAEQIATRISWMLSLALGQRVAWCDVGIRDGAKYALVHGRSVHFAKAPNKGGPISNDGEGTLRRFLETFYPIYLQHEDWWDRTIDWYAISRETSFIEVTGLIASMLLDRVCTFVLKGHQFPKQIDDNVKDALSGDNRGAMKSKLDEFMRQHLSARWDRSDAIISRILELNEGPAYPKKVAAAFDKLGLPPPAKAILANRNRLAHVGELEVGTDFGKYHDEIVTLTTTMLLKAAGYRGDYFAPGAGQQRL